MAATVIVAVSGLLDIEGFRRLWRIDRAEFVSAGVTGAAALAFDLIIGVAVGVILTFYLVLRSLNHPVVIALRWDPISREFLPSTSDDTGVAGLLVVRVEGGIYKLNARRAQSEVLELVERAGDGIRVLLLGLSGTIDTSVTVLDLLLETDQQLARAGTDLWLAAFPQKAEKKAQSTLVYEDWTARGKIHPSVVSALRAYQETEL